MQIQVGQTVYLEPTGNACRYSKTIIETRVSKVGRKYFEVENKRSKFDLEKMCEVSNICSDYAVYLSAQEIVDKNEKNTIIEILREFFGVYGHSKDLTLEQLKEIQKIIDGGIL
jgi:hypothetical protein